AKSRLDSDSFRSCRTADNKSTNREATARWNTPILAWMSENVSKKPKFDNPNFARIVLPITSGWPVIRQVSRGFLVHLVTCDTAASASCIGCDFEPVSTQLHAAPAPGPFLACVMEVQHALFTLADTIAINLREQRGCAVRHGSKQVFGPARIEPQLYRG